MTTPIKIKAGDSCEAKFSKAALFQTRGATLTHKRMMTTFRAVADVAKAGRWGKDVSPESLTEKQFVKYMEVRRETGLSPRCQANESAHIRRALRGVGREDFAASITNERLGIPQASRIGTGKATAPEVLAAARAAADECTRTVIDLCDGIGLRLREAACSTECLSMWRTELDNGQPLRVDEMTKNGRPRSVFIRSEESRQIASDAIDRGLAYLKESGEEFLIPSVSLDAAMRKISRDFEAVGLEGENSGHSLRRDFAVREYLDMREDGMTRRQACEKLSMALGHGSSRHRWVWNNYLKATLEDMGLADE